MSGTCICQSETDFYVDEDGSTLPADMEILCRKKPFIITKEIYMDEFLGGEMDMVYQANDDEFSYLEAQVKENKAEALEGLFRNIYKTVMGTHRKTCRKEVTCVPNSLVTENNSSNILDNICVSYLGNIVSPTNPKTDNLAEQVLPEKLNDRLVTTFCNLFQHVNTDSLSEVSPKVK